MATAPQNSQADLVNLSRKPVVNQLRAVADSLTKRAPINNMHGLVDENKLTWLLKCLAHLGNHHYPYQSYDHPEANNGIFKIQEPSQGDPGKGTTIALLSDWASDTPEAVNVAGLVGQRDYSIHLGDTYYVGNSKEIADSFNDDAGAPWPYGSKGSFAMLGNHEMYSSGKSYFTELLPYMGIYSDGKTVQRQEASYFCLENDYWRIIGLDTGYNSLRGIFGITPNTAMTLPDQQFAWLRDTVAMDKDRRGIILLSHHQAISAFDPYEFHGIVPQLAGLVGADRTVLWFCGHEHILALYGHNRLGGSLDCFTRCIGNGGMPVEINHLVPKSANPTDTANRNLVLFDKRIRNTIDDRIPLGHNGYTMLNLDKERLTVNYYDDSAGGASPILTEEWTIDVLSGKLTGVSITDHSGEDPLKASGQLTHFQDDLDLAIRP
jgi:hypothetical protein